jgi:hypothetical protein
MIPEARICHFTSERLRFKITGRREDHQYFSSVHEKLQKAGFAQSVVNPLTGSVIIKGKGIKVEEIAAFGKKTNFLPWLFQRKKNQEMNLFYKKSPLLFLESMLI